MIEDRLLAEIENVARERLARTREHIEASLNCIARGVPLAAETQMPRRIGRIVTKTDLTRGEAMIVSSALDQAAEMAVSAKRAAGTPGPEAIWGATLDFVGVGFLDRARHAANAVGRIARLGGQPHGTGFLVAPGLLLTNHHVIPTPAAAAELQVQFDYETDAFDRPRQPTAFALDPSACFVSDGIKGLDFTLIGVGPRRDGARQLEEFGFLILSDAPDKHMLGELANIIQHPDGRYKELVLRENHLVARDDTQQVLHYVADTEAGSSGSPVFNNQWEPIALHHWGGPWLEVMGNQGQPLSREINEGIRISAIVGALRDLADTSGDPVIRRALALWEQSFRQPETAPPHPAAGRAIAPGPRMEPDGAVTWTIPLELSLRLPHLAAPATHAAPEPPSVAIPGHDTLLADCGPGAENWKREDFSDRGGFEPGFIPGHVVPLPGTARLRGRLARNQLAAEGDDPHELRYHHFSILMNADRRLASLTAVNIDGARLKAVVRDTKTVISDPTLGQLGAEASDAFRPDRRILPEEQMNRPYYEKQIVPGYPVANSPDRIARMFQKGHIILRGDPAWGHEAEAKAAERDTFFYTNAAPQVGFFNQGSRLDQPGSKGKLRWRAVETYVLRNAFTMRNRISVFAGPVFDDDVDPLYRLGARVPVRFWKLAVWSDGEALRSIALLADQRPVLEVMPEAFDTWSTNHPGSEAFSDSEELTRVSEFLSSVEEIEELTGLDFGNDLRTGDLRGGKKATPTLDFTLTELSPNDRPTKRRKRKSAQNGVP